MTIELGHLPEALYRPCLCLDPTSIQSSAPAHHFANMFIFCIDKIFVDSITLDDNTIEYQWDDVHGLCIADVITRCDQNAIIFFQTSTLSYTISNILRTRRLRRNNEIKLNYKIQTILQNSLECFAKESHFTTERGAPAHSTSVPELRKSHSIQK